MNRRHLILIAALLLLLVLGACNMPGGQSAAQVETAAAETVSANFTQIALLTPSATFTPLASATLPATSTPAVTNTPFATNTAATGGSAGGGCDSIQFVSDVTVPDGQDFAANATFTKTWRLRNAGTCSWSTSYAVVFVSGNAMGAPAAQNLTGTIAPNSTVDISLNLTAPSSNGSYTGYFALRNASNQNFGSFYVQIDVTSGGSSGSTGGSGGNFSASAVGQVDANGNLGSAAHVGANSGTLVRGFVSFNIASIPDDATIEEVQVDFTGFDTQSNPFASGGCLQAYFGSYFPLDASDYGASGSGPDMEWCSTGELGTVYVFDDIAERIQDALGSSDTIEYQLRFSGTPTGSTLVRFFNGGMKLIITYSEP
jgi:hypothetical protein